MGGAYDASTGKFTVPQDGVYHFSWNVLRKGKSGLHIDLMVDGDIRFITWQSGTEEYKTVTGALFLQLKKGNKVWLRARQAGRILHANKHASFSGFMY